MKTFAQDLTSDLDEVQRPWIRIPATIIVSIVAAPIFTIIGAFQGLLQYWFAEFFLPCIKGEKIIES